MTDDAVPGMRSHSARPSRDAWLAVFVFLFLAGAQAFAVLTSSPDRDMGHLQKIMYVHVPAAWMSLLVPAVVLVFSVLYLFRGRETDDLLAASAAEVGAAFSGLTLVLGMLWGRPTWGVWWVWDARLTSMLVLFLLLLGYLSLRAFVEDQDRRARWSAAVGLLTALNVPIVYMSVRWWRTLHQVQSSPETVDPAYVLGLRANAFAFLFVMIYFIRLRYQAARLERAAEQAAESAALGRA